MLEHNQFMVLYREEGGPQARASVVPTRPSYDAGCLRYNAAGPWDDGTTPGGGRGMASRERAIVVEARGGEGAVGRPPKGPGGKRGTARRQRPPPAGAAVVHPSRIRAAALAKGEAQREARGRAAWEQRGIYTCTCPLEAFAEDSHQVVYLNSSSSQCHWSATRLAQSCCNAEVQACRRG